MPGEAGHQALTPPLARCWRAHRDRYSDCASSAAEILNNCGQESHRRGHAHKDKASTEGGRHDDRLIRAAQPVAGWRCCSVYSHSALRRSSPPLRQPRSSACRRRAASAGLAADRAARGQRSRRQACPDRAAADRGGPGQAAARQAQGAARLQHRSLRRRHGQCAFAGRRRQGHGVRRHPPRRQRLCHHQQGRQALGQDAGVGPPSAQRHRVQERHAVHRRTLEGLQGRQDRG